MIDNAWAFTFQRFEKLSNQIKYLIYKELASKRTNPEAPRTLYVFIILTFKALLLPPARIARRATILLPTCIVPLSPQKRVNLFVSKY
jgi:hypothetical protein